MELSVQLLLSKREPVLQRAEPEVRVGPAWPVAARFADEIRRRLLLVRARGHGDYAHGVPGDEELRRWRAREPGDGHVRSDADDADIGRLGGRELLVAFVLAAEDDP